MQDSDLPKIKRDIPKVMIFLVKGLVYFIFVPLNWLMINLGGSPGLALRGGKQYESLLEILNNSLVDYQPTERDVFINTFSMSGTNWMMQIAH